ncbi:hypothetical protein [Thalassotalea atypica]|uniref:hypothetical protein n=1 Tax=Thalassotalea atypica TaxID=2054316 RepID=UPI002572EAFF|nr:hypothetical protein [Thalassotalea atypica]
MTSITRFVLNMKYKQLHLVSSNQEKGEDETMCFPMEFLRVIDHEADKLHAHKKSKPTLITNRKGVLLVAVESVGKHGFRLLFDDQFQRIVTEEELGYLYANQSVLWQQYLDDIKSSGLTRETAIEIKAL